MAARPLVVYTRYRLSRMLGLAASRAPRNTAQPSTGSRGGAGFGSAALIGQVEPRPARDREGGSVSRAARMALPIMPDFASRHRDRLRNPAPRRGTARG